MGTLESNESDESGRLDQKLSELGPWFHNLHLPCGAQTAPDHPLGDFPTFKWEQLECALPADLSEMTVLDVGCNAGFYSFELARRGARVVGIDADSHYLRQARWANARFELQSRVTFRKMQVYELAHTSERFDLVLFMGVFYHLRYPLLALDIVAQRTKQMMVFQSLSMHGDGDSIEQPENLGLNERELLNRSGWPKMAFLRHRLADDPTNWWVPNGACVEALLHDVGFEIARSPGEELYVCEPATRHRVDWTHRLEQLAAIIGLGITTSR